MLAANEGVRGFYKGLSVRLIANVPNSAIAFFGYELVKSWSLKEKTQ